MLKITPGAVSDNNNNNYENACQTIAAHIQKEDGLSANQVSRIIKRISSEYHLATLPKNEHIIGHLPEHSRYRKILRVKPAKTASGVAVIAVMPKPYECPHGKCIYCPGGIEYNTPLSYTGSEPATKTAQQVQFDPYEQVASKMKQLRSRGHDIGKTEIVIVGGTFPFMPEDYQRNFAKSCYDALNGFRSPSLQESIRHNEVSKNRCVGFTVETKPDYCKRRHIDLMLEFGVTRVEIGVQSLQDKVYQAVNRGHDLGDVVESFQIARDAGYKIVAHMMPGLPNSSPEKDIEDFRNLFEGESFKPDMLKIYPTLVLEGTGLYELHQRGRYSVYSDDDLVNVLVEVKKMVPPWVRIMRVQREIEAKDIVAGPKSGNLRQIVVQKLKKQGHKCVCIRCREVGLQKKYPAEDQVMLYRQDYSAALGQEVFLSFESHDRNTILGFLRLRKVANPHRPELKDAAIVRELHIYGQMVNVGTKASDSSGRDSGSYQHRGYGMKLIKEAERIAKHEFGVKKLSVISAVGTREYYKKQLGYSQDGCYVSKVL